MRILSNGVRPDGTLLIPELTEEEFAEQLRNGFERNLAEIQPPPTDTLQADGFRGEIKRKVVDPGDPLSVGWTYLVNFSDPKLENYREIIREFARRRGMADPDLPLYYNGEKREQWFNWISENYLGLRLQEKPIPLYIMIVGGPDQVPFRFQSLLSTIAYVGRVAFDELEDLKTYLAKLVRLESAPDPVVSREAVIFAPVRSALDVTFHSHEYMAKPINDFLVNDRAFRTTPLMIRNATKSNLQQAFREKKPSLVFTASHGLGPGKETTLADQMLSNGSIQCQFSREAPNDDFFGASDVPMNIPFLEGSAFVQFACFGYGTPAFSDYTHWLKGVPEQYAEKDFVAALPKALLKHPNGPIIYIGHLDLAFLLAFDDPENPIATGRWTKRISPFVGMLDKLLNVDPSGLSIRDMNDRYNICNAILTDYYDRMKRGEKLADKSMIDNWILRSDAQNYMVFGDPAAKLRIPDN